MNFMIISGLPVPDWLGTLLCILYCVYVYNGTLLCLTMYIVLFVTFVL